MTFRMFLTSPRHSVGDATSVQWRRKGRSTATLAGGMGGGVIGRETTAQVTAHETAQVTAQVAAVLEAAKLPIAFGSAYVFYSPTTVTDFSPSSADVVLVGTEIGPFGLILR
jgi:hypothetical protein